MPTLLVVDDIQGIHEMLDLVFEGTGFVLEHAMLAHEALAIYQQKNIDVVLSDIQMPGMSGLELYEELKRIDPAVIMVMTTATESRDSIIQSLRMGAFDYIEKPYDEEYLIKRMKRAAIERKKRIDELTGTDSSAAEVSKLKKELAERDKQLATVEKKEAEIKTLRKELSDQKESLVSSEQKRKELDKQRMELELREGALQTMEVVMKERMAKLKSSQANSGITAEHATKLKEMETQLKEREEELQSMELSIQERETFIAETEESLLSKGMRLQELEAELEQMREDLQKSGGRELSESAQKEVTAMSAKLAEKEEALKSMEDKLLDKERSIKKAEALIKAREQFLAQSEAILLGEGH